MSWKVGDKIHLLICESPLQHPEEYKNYKVREMAPDGTCDCFETKLPLIARLPEFPEVCANCKWLMLYEVTR